MIRVRGVGWISGPEFGGVRLAQRHAFPPGATLHTLWRDAHLLPAPPKNAGRFNAAVHLTCGAIALALRDAGLECVGDRKRDIGLLAATPDGCLAANRAYFEDYLTGGRTMGRGNLFIYTLPTSAAAEAAICFGLQGPLFYAAGSGRPAHALLATACGMMERGEAAGMLALLAEGDAALCFFLAEAAAAPHHDVCAVEEALRATDIDAPLAELIGNIAGRPPSA